MLLSHLYSFSYIYLFQKWLMRLRYELAYAPFVRTPYFLWLLCANATRSL